MKCIISATLSVEAWQIYDSWKRQQKSRILSDLIVSSNSYLETINELQSDRKDHFTLLSKIQVKLQIKDGITPLVEEINNALKGTIHWQPFSDEYRAVKKKEQKENWSDLDKMNQEAFEKTGKYLF